MADPALLDEVAVQRDSAKALLLTILGEFVLPTGGAAWTSALVAAGGELGIGEKNARQAIARIGEQGLITGERHGRSVRWALTSAGRDLLESGAERIYGFGRAGDAWSGEWVVVHCPVAESQRATRQRLRTQLGFLGFGELSPSLFIGPHVERSGALDRVFAELELGQEPVVFRSTTMTPDDDVVARAWDLDALAASYRTFVETVASATPATPAETFRAVVELVHAWRRFPFIDPELPRRLLPTPWIGAEAVERFHDRHRAWSPTARNWFAALT